VRRLLLVSQRPLDLQGGATLRWRYFAEALPRLGWKVSVVSMGQPATDAGGDGLPTGGWRRGARGAARAGVAALRRAGVEVTAWMPGPQWAFTGRRPIERAIERARPDVVWVTCPPPGAMFAAAAVARRYRVPLVLEFRDLWAGAYDNDFGRPWLARLQARAVARAARVVVVTPDAASRLAQLHPNAAGRIVTLPNGFHPSVLAQRRPAGSLREPAQLVHAGQLYGSRRIDGLIAALERPELRGRARLLQLGAINDRSLQAIGAAGAAVDVEVGGAVSWQDAIAAQAAADIAVVLLTPGDDTAIPGKLYEALALGVPILGLIGPDSALGRMLVRVGQERGVAPHDDPAAIAAAIERLLTERPDPLSPALLAPYDRSLIAERVRDLLEELVRASGARPSPRASALPPDVVEDVGELVGGREVDVL
jgi:glycosyltransferase involved in cell wall biosynthesis